MGGIGKENDVAAKGKRVKADEKVVDFALPFIKSLAFTGDLERLTSKVSPSSKAPRQRGSVCAFMQVVLVSLFCRLRHLQKLISANDVTTFNQVLYSGCSSNRELMATELQFAEIVDECTAVDAKNIIAFWQAGICGLHSYNVVHDNIKGVAQKTAVHSWMIKMLGDGTFDLDRDWLLNRRFLANYRSKSLLATLPKWDVSCFSKSGSRTPTIFTSIGHIDKVAWIVPRNDSENVEFLSMEEAPESILTAEIKAVWNQPIFSDKSAALSLPHPVPKCAAELNLPVLQFDHFRWFQCLNFFDRLFPCGNFKMHLTPSLSRPIKLVL